MKNNINYILQKSINSHNLDEKEILLLLKTKSIKKLTSSADMIRKKYLGDEVHLRALIEFSNYCKQNCLYCGLQKTNLKLERYRIKEQDIINLAKQAKNYGYKTVVLQSGEDPYYTIKKMVYIISEIKKLDLAITLSIGEKTFNEYKSYRQAGADRYLLRIETTDEKLYNKLNPGMNLKNRMQCLENIKKIGFEVGSGIMVGLPWQTLESIAKDIIYLKSIPVAMAGIGPFIYNPDTSISHLEKINKNNHFDLSLKVMAILRLIMPDINIPATTAMETLDHNGRLIALQSGANVVMPNATETIYRKKYEIYPGKICLNDSPGHCRTCIESKIKSIGRFISKSKGFHNSNVAI
ncbi:MAG: [FeFe] hydrogenase H-cluster radical SAM maturase HydE [Endomicrobium sp.]|jgi:biotin synthase|uniref:[FeFe] hydrogenase H-cluster radical SAM maturase HydE n=1 Tax=Candidatus Endomicrobiellum cubanum TaxID=3242325 RepID=UPI00283348E4|nr:[FeFe] hydrogenase H-cluster radical SAM maturase HydE [Endomicrobium sp.]